MRRRRIQAFAATEIGPEVRLWVLRLLVVLDGHREFIKIDGLQNFSLANFLGMEHWSEPIDGQFDWVDARKEPDQAWRLFALYCLLRNFPPPSLHLREELRRLSTLTLGDFAVIDRQRLFNHIDTADAVLTELIKECSFKDDKRIRIGFL